MQLFFFFSFFKEIHRKGENNGERSHKLSSKQKQRCREQMYGHQVGKWEVGRIGRWVLTYIHYYVQDR